MSVPAPTHTWEHILTGPEDGGTVVGNRLGSLVAVIGRNNRYPRPDDDMVIERNPAHSPEVRLRSDVDIIPEGDILAVAEDAVPGDLDMVDP